MMKVDIIAFCGLLCHECPAYRATQLNDDQLRAETAAKWSEMFQTELKAEMINCNGCHTQTGEIFGHCQVCEIRKCGLEKELDNCAGCSDYGCQRLSDFFALAPEAQSNLEKLHGLNREVK